MVHMCVKLGARSHSSGPDLPVLNACSHDHVFVAPDFDFIFLEKGVSVLAPHTTGSSASEPGIVASRAATQGLLRNTAKA